MPPQLRKFDMASIKHDKVVVLIGNRCTGKSYLVRDLLFHQRDMPIGTVISPTEAVHKFFGNIVPPILIHDEYSPAILKNVVKRQEILVRKIATEQQPASRNIDPRAFLVLDDCLYDNSWTKDTNVRRMFTEGRRLNIMFVIAMQFPLGIPPDLRAHIDYTFILRENLVSNRKRIHENYVSLFPTFDIFCQIMDQCTENFECIVIDNTAPQGGLLEDRVFRYKAELHDDFRIGADEFWALSEKH
jgi:hypothetical protein